MRRTTTIDHYEVVKQQRTLSNGSLTADTNSHRTLGTIPYDTYLVFYQLQGISSTAFFQLSELAPTRSISVVL
jgi:hypothetical protein